MADKSQPLILKALSQAIGYAEGLPLFASKTTPGLFASTAAGKQAAQRCLDEGYLSSLSPSYSTDPPVGPGRKARAVPEPFVLTEKGFSFLFQQVNPRQVLEDLVRVLEHRQTEVTELTRAASRMQLSLEALRASTEQVLRTLQPANGGPGSLASLFQAFREGQASPPPPAPAATQEPESAPVPSSLEELAVEESTLLHLARWQTTSGASEDCPLPELFRQVQAQLPRLSVGQFHDVLRRLRDAGAIYLHPWTGPLYDLPEPPKALLAGHEVAYYASLRPEAALEGFRLEAGSTT